MSYIVSGLRHIYNRQIYNLEITFGGVSVTEPIVDDSLVQMAEDAVKGLLTQPNPWKGPPNVWPGGKIPDAAIGVSEPFSGVDFFVPGDLALPNSSPSTSGNIQVNRNLTMPVDRNAIVKQSLSDWSQPGIRPPPPSLTPMALNQFLQGQIPAIIKGKPGAQILPKKGPNISLD